MHPRPRPRASGFCVDDDALKNALETARARGISHKFCSNFQGSLTAGTEDDWVFLRNSLQPCLEFLRLHYQQVYQEESHQSQITGSWSLKTATLVDESMIAIQASVKSPGAVQMLQRYSARIQALLRRDVEDVFSVSKQQR